MSPSSHLEDFNLLSKSCRARYTIYAMVFPNLSELKHEILTALERAGQPMHRINLIGRDFQQGQLELTRARRFTFEERVLAYRAYDELKQDDLLRPTYNDLADPENWVIITDAGRAFLRSGQTAKEEVLRWPKAQVAKLTLDANCVVNIFDVRTATATSVNELLELMRMGLSHAVQISITTRVEDDVLQDKDLKRKAEMLRILATFPIVSGAGDPALAKEIQRVVFPGLLETDRRFLNKQRDVEHLAAHGRNGRDVFVTDDTMLVKKSQDLQSQFGITVMRPAQCIALVESGTRRAAAIPKATAADAKYSSPGLRGRVSFDYSTNNGRFVIGTGRASFETIWSKASNRSIHAYSDSSTVDAIALAKGAKGISDVTDAASHDFSSRVRSPDIDQVVIWRNSSGLYAATQIVAIKDDSRGDDADELIFDYVILPNGRTDF